MEMALDVRNFRCLALVQPLGNKIIAFDKDKQALSVFWRMLQINYAMTAPFSSEFFSFRAEDIQFILSWQYMA